VQGPGEVKVGDEARVSETEVSAFFCSTNTLGIILVVEGLADELRTEE